MSGLAPLSGSTTPSALPGVAIAAPGSGTSGAPPLNKSDGPNFTAFPSSYDGFGANGSAFGTLSVVNGKLSVTTTAAGHGAQTPDPYAAVPPVTPGLEKASATEQKAATEKSTLDNVNGNGNAETGSGVQGSSSGPDQTQSPAAQPPEPTAGLLAAKDPEPIPGGTPVENDPALGLLGAPATNPIVIQAEQQEAAAAEEAAAAAAAADAERITAQTQLQQVDFRIAAARADNNEAAVAQLQPTAAKLTGQIQSQAFSGLGTAPPQPFARPEIPTVFLNVAS